MLNSAFSDKDEVVPGCSKEFNSALLFRVKFIYTKQWENVGGIITFRILQPRCYRNCKRLPKCPKFRRLVSIFFSEAMASPLAPPTLKVYLSPLLRVNVPLRNYRLFIRS